MAGSKLARLRARKHWSQEHVSALLEVDVVTLSRWEQGKRRPRGYNVEKLCSVYGCTAEDLGLGEAGTDISASPSSLIASFIAGDLSTRLLTLAFVTHCSYTEVQARIRFILEEYDAMNNLNTHSITRRDALQRLIALSLYPAVGVLQGDEALNQCAASIVACHELGRGKDSADLALAFQGASAALEKLKPLLVLSRHRKAAATIAAQAARLQNMLIGHLEGVEAAIPYAKQAVSYSKEANDIPEYLMTLVSLAWAYYNAAPRFGKYALQSMEQAVAVMQEHRTDVPSSVRGQVYGTLAVMQARNGVPGNASLHLAVKHTFIDQSYTMFMDDPIFSLIMYEAEALQHLPGGSNEVIATLSQFVDSTTFNAKRAMPGRDHMRVLTNMTQLSLKAKERDLEYSVRLWKTTMQKVQEFRSERRFEEATKAYDVMSMLWSDDARVQALRPLTVHW